MALAGHQFPRALALAFGTSAAQEAAVVQEEPQQIQIRAAQVAAQGEAGAQPRVQVLHQRAAVRGVRHGPAHGGEERVELAPSLRAKPVPPLPVCGRDGGRISPAYAVQQAGLAHEGLGDGVGVRDAGQLGIAHAGEGEQGVALVLQRDAHRADASGSYAAIELLAAVRRQVTVITRLRLDARLFDPPPPRLPGTKGRPRVSGARQPTLLQRLADPKMAWQRVTVTGWYGQTERRLDVVSGTALWYHPGKQVPVRWVLVRDPAGAFEPQAFLCTDQAADPLTILQSFVRRWSVEVTFAEVRRHLGVETQRQWSDLAIARTTPCLLALFSLITLWASDLAARGLVLPRRAAWYAKPDITFSDALAAIRRQLWIAQAFSTSPHAQNMATIPRALLDSLTEAACEVVSVLRTGG